jgi:threonine dehydrogenase-like Zn-dependent dehydrogenase
MPSCRLRSSAPSTAGIYGYTHEFGGYAGSHAQYVRVPFGDVNCFPIPDFVTDEQALFMSDAVPTGYMGADFCDIAAGDTVAVWGAGGVGLMSARSALLHGAGRVVSIDRIPERLALARQLGAETINYAEVDSVQELLRDMTGGRGPDAVIEAVGMEAHSTGAQEVYDRAKQLLRLETDRASSLREAACRKGGVVSVLGLFGLMDKFPMGVIMNRGLTLRSAQQHGQRYIHQFFDYVEQGDLDPSVLLTHDLPLGDGVRAYDIFKNKSEGCIRAACGPSRQLSQI